MAKPKRDKAKDKELEPDYGLQHEAFMKPGETPQSNQVFNTIFAAKNALRDNFKFEEQADIVGWHRLSDIEKAYVQRRLQKELVGEMQVIIPVSLEVDEKVLGDEEAERRKEFKPRVVDPGSAAEVAATEHAELVKTAIEIIHDRFNRAQEDGSAFSLGDVIAEYQEALGDDGARDVREQLERAMITDLKEVVKRSEAPIQSPEPESAQGQRKFMRFEYRNGKLYTVNKYGGSDKEQISTRPYEGDGFDLPEKFKKIAKDPEKLARALKGLAVLYREVYARKVYSRPVPMGWQRYGKIDSLEVFFERTGRSIDFPQNEETEKMMQKVNDKIKELKERQEAGERIDLKNEYWKASGYEAWREEEVGRIRQKHIRDTISEEIDALLSEGVNQSAPEPAQPDEEESAVAPETPEEAEPSEDVLPDPAGVMGDETLTPADVGMSEDQEKKLREIIEQLLADKYAKKIREKHPLGDFPRMTDARVRAVAEGYVTDVDVEDLFQAKLRQIKDKQASAS